MDIKTIDLEVDNGESANFLHISDSHLTYGDSRDPEEKIRQAEDRLALFSKECSFLKELDLAIDYASKECDLLLHTGDMIDFVSYRNLEVAKEKLAACDHFFACGNHEFSHYLGEAKEDEDYKAKSYDLVSCYFKDNLTFASRIFKGINLVSAFNGYYYFTKKQTSLLQEELKKPYPIFLLIHVPLFTEDLYRASMERHKVCAFLVGAPDKYTQAYQGFRKDHQRANEETLEFIKIVEEACKKGKIKAILAGHTHFDWQDDYYGAKQIVSAGTIYGKANLIRVNP